MSIEKTNSIEYNEQELKIASVMYSSESIKFKLAEMVPANLYFDILAVAEIYYETTLSTMASLIAFPENLNSAESNRKIADKMFLELKKEAINLRKQADKERLSEGVSKCIH